MSAGQSYKQVLLTYVDVLGFSKLISDSRQDSSVIQKIRFVLSAARDQLSNTYGLHSDSPDQTSKTFNTYSFSDLSLRCTHVVRGMCEAVNAEMAYMAAAQLKLVLSKVLVRGGICIGEIVDDKESQMVFGPGMVKAYLLEHEFAVYPRIVVDRDIINELGAREPIWQDPICRGEDGSYYLDYLFYIFLQEYCFGSKPKAFNVFEEHRNVVKEKIASISSGEERNERAKQKIMWLARYHQRAIQRACDRFSDKPEALDQLHSSDIVDAQLRF